MTNAPDSPDDRDERDERDEYAEVDPERVTEDAIEYFEQPPAETDSPASDADAPPPG